MTYVAGLFDQIDLRDLYPYLRGNPKMLPCPAHDDQRPSLAVYKSNTHCHAGSCSFHESIMQHIYRVFNCRNNSEFIEAATRLTRLPSLFKPPAKQPPVFDSALPLRCHHRLMDDPEGIEWMKARYGLTIETIRDAGIGHNGEAAFTVPIRDISGVDVSLKFRRDDRKSLDGLKYYSLAGYGQTRLYIPKGLQGAETLQDALWSFLRPNNPGPYRKRAVLLTEGEMDSLAACQVGIPSVSFTSGCRSALSNPSLLSALAGLSVCVAYDMDSPGQDSATSMLALLGSVGIPSKRVTWNASLGKDISDLVRSGLTAPEMKQLFHFS